MGRLQLEIKLYIEEQRMRGLVLGQCADSERERKKKKKDFKLTRRRPGGSLEG